MPGFPSYKMEEMQELSSMVVHVQQMHAQQQEVAQTIKTILWPKVPDLIQHTGTTTWDIAPRFFVYLPNVLLKLGANEGEAIMTRLGQWVMGAFVPQLYAAVRILGCQPRGMLIARPCGVPIVDVWQTFSGFQRAVTRRNLARALVKMRSRDTIFDYYGRPGQRPYITSSADGTRVVHTYCRSRQEWDASRIRALFETAAESEISESDIRNLATIQTLTAIDESALVDTPVLTHANLSDRNIFIDPRTYEITGLLEWDLAIVAPAYFEYASACLDSAHSPEWRKELIEVMRHVLSTECEIQAARSSANVGGQTVQSNHLFEKTIRQWNYLVDVERPAQGYSSACFWTFEHHDSSSDDSNSDVEQEIPEMPETPETPIDPGINSSATDMSWKGTMGF